MNKIAKQAFLQNTKSISDLKYILSIIRSYKGHEELGIRDLVSPEKVEAHYLDWLHLWSKFNGNEKEFFSPHWFPLSTSNYDFFLVMNSPVYPVIYTRVKWFDFSNYEKFIYFYQVQHLLVVLDSEICNKEFYDEFSINCLDSRMKADY